MRRSAYGARALSSPSVKTREPAKRRPSLTNEMDVPKRLPKRDADRLPAVARFEMALKSVEVVEGETAHFNCKIRGNPPPSIYWYKNNEAIDVPSHRIWTETCSDGSHGLVVKNVKLSDKGNYRCTVINRLGRATSSGKLNVLGFGVKKKDSSVSVLKRRKSFSSRKENSPKISSGVKTRINPPASFNSAPATPQIVKSRTPQTDKRSTPDLRSERPNSVRRISLVSTASLASLSSSKNEVEAIKISQSSGEDIPAMNGFVEKSPQFTLKPISKVAEEGKSISFRCRIAAEPEPTVEWFKGAVRLSQSDRHSLENLPSGESVLTIEELRATDAGKYRCVASNLAGKASCSVELVLAAKQAVSQMASERTPSFSQTFNPAEIQAGGRIRFECKVDGRPKPTVEWSKDGKVVSASSRVRITDIYGMHSLVISRAETTDSGLYTATASNHVGSDSCSAQLHIQDMSASRVSSASQLSTSRSDRSSPNTSNLSSPSMSPKLGRRVTPTSRPVSGNSSPWASGIKTGGGGPPPRRRGPGFILRPRPQTVADGENMCLKCTLLGHPKPTVTWEKDGELVDDDRTDGHIQTRNDGNDYFLEIEECSGDDAGKYTVTARNSLGKQTASVEVTVTGAGQGTKSTKPKAASTPKSNHVNSTDSNHTTPRHEETNNRHAVAERPRVGELILPVNSKPDDSKPSPTNSVSSTLSSNSRMSTSSSRSNEVEEDGHRKPSRKRTIFVAPTFTRRLSSTQVLEGEELLLQCEVTGDPEPELTWLRNGLEVGIDEDEVFTSFRSGIARLRLRDLIASHAGEYVCRARNDAGMIQCSSRVTVKPKRVQTRPRFIRTLSDVRVTEGETLTLEAEVEGCPTPEIVWSLDGEEVSNADCNFVRNVATLKLKNVSTSSSGQYMCNALNSEGEDSVACRVRIKAKKTDITPEFTAPLSDVEVTDGDDVCLRCMVTGIPEPKVEWTYNDEVLEAEEGIEISYHDGVAALTLEQATDEDTGTYTCTAVNTEGKAKTSCQVTVAAAKKPAKKDTPTVPPKFINPFDEYIRTQEGDTITLECTVGGNPEPEVKWTVEDHSVENGEASLEDGVAKLVISPIQASHSGHVKCTLQNAAGKASHEARIYVRSKRVAPSFETDLPSSIDVAEDAEAYFECKVTGHPQPRVTWTRDGRSLSILTTETSYEDGTASVRIRKAGPREGGKYVCTARNLSGEAQSVCDVKVIKKVEEPTKPATQAPSFTSKLTDQALDDGQDLKLQCTVEGTPAPELSWYVDGQRLEAEDGEATFKDGVAKMVLEDAMQEDSGEYKCVAMNSAGKAETSCRVTVRAPGKDAPPSKAANKEPTFPLVLEDQTVKEGHDIVLKCKVLGNPRPTIKWLLDGGEIVDAEVKYDEEGNIELVLPEALPEDEGVYTCIAENPHKRVMCSCTVTIEVPPKPSKKKPAPAKQQQDVPSQPMQNNNNSEAMVKPSFVKELQDITVADGSTNFKLSCKAAGNPPPTAKWFLDEEEIEASEDFMQESVGDVRSLKLAEVFPEDGGVYTCVLSNKAGEAKTKCTVKVEEIDGDPPAFVLKPKPINVNAGEKATFACRVDGDPAPTVEWLFCNQPLQDPDRHRVVDANQSNNNTHMLEIPIVSAQDAGRYSVCCRNLLGDITCTVSLIVNDAKRQESRKDFRDVLKRSPAVKTNSANKQAGEEQVDFRSVLRRQSTDKDPSKRSTSTSGSDDAGDDPGAIYKDALTTSVRTKALSEEERKLRRADQKDFRSNLVRKVDTKVTTHEAVRSRQAEQVDFRDEALKTKVQTKAIGQEDLKVMHAEQKDFRGETIKSRVVTKAYKEEAIKAKRAEQVDFRDVLSPTKRNADAPKEGEPSVARIAELPKAKFKKDSSVDHNTVATKRSRNRATVPERKVQQNGGDEHEEPAWSKPSFSKPLEDLETEDGKPLELVCHVTGEPTPEIKWFLEEDEMKADADITISYEGDVCRLSIAESFPEDQGKYTCTVSNEHGQASSSCFVTVLADG